MSAGNRRRPRSAAKRRRPRRRRRGAAPRTAGVLALSRRRRQVSRTLGAAFSGAAECRDPRATRVFPAADLEEALVRAVGFLRTCEEEGGCY